jgi:hypothetical protein
VAASDGAKPASLERAVTELPPRRRVQVLLARPPDISAPVALADIDVVVVSADDDSAGTAGEAFDPEGLHEWAIRHKSTVVKSLERGTPRESRAPANADARQDLPPPGRLL